MSPGDSPVMLTKGLIGKRKAEDEVAGLRKRSSAAESAVDRELEREEEDDGEGLDQYCEYSAEARAIYHHNADHKPARYASPALHDQSALYGELMSVLSRCNL